jgi:RNA polymerase sigma-70 factor (ECF subfamily)
VQESWLRLTRSDDTAIVNLGGWLTTVVARVSLDVLRARRSRREDYFGTWLPEPIVTLPTTRATRSTRRSSRTRLGSRCSWC